MAAVAVMPPKKGAVAFAAHAVEYHGTQQGFDGAQHRNGQSSWQQFPQRLPRPDHRFAPRPFPQPRPLKMRQHSRDAGTAAAVGQGETETGADGVHRMSAAGQQQGGDARQQNRRQMGRHRRAQPRPQQHYRQRQGRHGHAWPVHGASVRCQHLQLGDEVLGHYRDGQAEQILQLQRHDDHRDAACEAQHHRLGNVLNQAPQPQQRHAHQNDTGHDSGDQQATKPPGLRDGVEDDDEGGGGARDAVARAAAQGDEEAADDGRVQPVLRRHATGDGQRHGQWDRDDAHRDARQHILVEAAQGIGLTQHALTQGMGKLQGEQGASVHGGHHSNEAGVAIVRLRAGAQGMTTISPGRDRGFPCPAPRQSARRRRRWP